ncbi:hypothetical protein Clacol_001720 [Clathrus columnatus]|uniref:Oxidoreductase n=1 Tax=Clathrus columnatus TaxID=1419009 RepID=A0AAV5A204_9AGAM|nr:hypothetical protein Clacol_001720 [Clathrus columnatus]
MSSNPIKTAVIGVGLAGMVFHLPLLVALPDLFDVCVVVERNSQQEGGKARKFGINPKVVETVEQAILDPEIELVIIGTPNATHYPFAKAALAAGKHVLVDKPIVPTYEEALTLLDLARSKNLILYAFQNRRWDSDFLVVKKLIQDRTLGDLTEFESHFDRYRTSLRVHWHGSNTPGSGLLYDLGTHLIDQALVLFGKPQKITAFTQNILELGDVEDNFTILLHYLPDETKIYPITAILRSHFLSVRTPQFRYSVKGSKGTFTKEGVDIQEDQLKAYDIPPFDPNFGIEPADIHGVLEILQEDGSITKSRIPSERGSYVSLYRNVAAAIREGAPLDVKWEEASTVIQLIELAKQSVLEEKTMDVPV